MVRLVALTLLGATSSLPLGGGALAESNRGRFASPILHAAQSFATAQPAAAEGEKAAESAVQAPEPVVAPNEPPSEVVVERYPNGKVKIERYVTQDAQRNYVNHGPWRLFDVNGHPIATGHYKMGKRDGSWWRVQPKSSKDLVGPVYKGFVQPFVWEASFTDDVLNGVWKILDAEGRPIRTWEFEQGRLHGKLIDWHANGHERREVHYDQGIPQGELCEWDKTGKLVAQSTYENGRPHRTFVEKYPTGEKKVRISLLGPKEMVRVTFNWPEGTMQVDVADVESKEVRHGLWISWHRDGRTQFEGSYERDKPVGLHTWWYANGQKQISGQFVNGQETGRWTWWHENSGRSVEGEFVEGKKEGDWTTWHPNGQKRAVANYAAGKKTGQWSRWDEAGKLIESRDRSSDPAGPNETRTSPGEREYSEWHPAERSVLSHPREDQARGRGNERTR